MPKHLINNHDMSLKRLHLIQHIFMRLSLSLV